MKHILYCALFSLCIFAGCAKNIEFENREDGVHSFCINTVVPSLETSGMDTKASMKTVIKLQWSDGDQISVINLSTGKTMMGNLAAIVDGDRVRFEGELGGAIKAGDRMAAIYPCQNFDAITSIEDFEVDLSTQKCSSINDLPFAAYSVFECEKTGIVNVTSDFSVPVSFNQIALATIDTETKIDYVELTNVGKGVNFHIGESELSLTPSVGKVRIMPESKLSGKNGALFTYCALAASPASNRTITIKALPKIYYASWAESAMTSAKYYTSVASDFKSLEYNDLMVIAHSSLNVPCNGGTVVFSVSSNKINWQASCTPAVSIDPASGGDCDNQDVTFTFPQNNGTAERSFLVMFKGGDMEYNYKITQQADVNKEIIEFADINLKKYLLSLYDDNEDGEIGVLEAENIQNVNCSGRNITDLLGLERCPNLKYLNFNGNYVTELKLTDMSKLETIFAYDNPLEKIVLNNDVALENLYLRDASTDVLSETTCNIDAYDLAETLYLAFSGTKYTTLNLTNSSVLTSFDISENVQLTELVASGNSLVTGLNLATLTNLTDLDISNCGIESLNVDSNTKLVNFDCSNNRIASLNVDDNLCLVNFDCSHNSLSSLSIVNNTLLETVDVSDNNLSRLNVRQNTNLKALNLSSNTGVSALALDNNASLEILDASSTSLTSIDLFSNPELKELYLADCESIDIIDLTENTALMVLNVSSTSISALDVSKNTALVTLDYKEGLKITGINSIGRYIRVNGMQGVTFFCSESITKIVSIDEIENYWGNYGNFDATSSNDGFANTNKIIASSSAARWCRAKGSEWYMPALDELWIIYNNINTLNSTLEEISGTELHSSYYWSSTEYSHDYAYAFRLYSGWESPGGVEIYKNKECFVRAVRAL